MGIGHMVDGSIAAGLVLLFLGWGLSVAAVLIGALTSGIGFLLFGVIYVVVWIWSIIDVKSVAERKNRQ